jgi:hypothetical protein
MKEDQTMLDAFCFEKRTDRSITFEIFYDIRTSLFNNSVWTIQVRLEDTVRERERERERVGVDKGG